MESGGAAAAMESAGGGGGGAAAGREKEAVAAANKRRISCSHLGLRVLAFALTFAAAMLLGLNKETAYVYVSLLPNVPPLRVPATAKWHYLSAFVYFVVANAIAGGYAVMSAVLTMANGYGKTKALSLLIIISDLVMVALLFSAASAATAVGVLGAEGNSHLQWKKVCPMFDKFCRKVAAALSVSLAGSVVFFLLVLISVWNLHKQHYQ